MLHTVSFGSCASCPAGRCKQGGVHVGQVRGHAPAAFGRASMAFVTLLVQAIKRLHASRKVALYTRSNAVSRQHDWRSCSADYSRMMNCVSWIDVPACLRSSSLQ